MKIEDFEEKHVAVAVLVIGVVIVALTIGMLTGLKVTLFILCMLTGVALIAAGLVMLNL